MGCHKIIEHESLYRQTSLYVVFLSAFLQLQIGHFSGTYPPIYSHSWSFYVRICYMQAKFFSPYLSHITRSNCTTIFEKFTALILLLKTNKRFCSLQFSKGAITFYTALIFEEADTIVDPNDCALIIGVSYFLSSILGLVLKKHVGRRILLLMSELGMAISQIAMGIYFYILNDVRYSMKVSYEFLSYVINFSTLSYFR
jgi:hypothetical protein